MFGNLFSFLADSNNYDTRMVARYEEGETIVSTAFTSDTAGFETAVCDPRWNDGKWVILEPYGERADAESGHARWVALLTGPDAPKVLQDRGVSPLAELGDALYGDDSWRRHGDDEQ